MFRRRTFALLLDYYGGDYQTALIQGAEEAITRNDENLVIAVGRLLDAPKPFDAVQNDIYYHLNHPGTDAIVFAAGCLSHHVSNERLVQICSSYAPLPLVSISVKIPGFPSAVVDNRRAQRQVVEHMIEVHHATKIVYLRGPSASSEANERLEGYQEALDAHGLRYDPTLVIEGNFWITSGKEAVLRLHESNTKYDTIVAANDYMALGALEGLKSLGVQVPTDVRLAGFDDAPASRMAAPSLTTVRQPIHRMGVLAVELLNDLLDSNAVEDVYRLGVELVRRQSCGCGHGVNLHQSRKSDRPMLTFSVERLSLMRSDLERAILDGITIHSEDWPVIVESLVTALLAEASGNAGRFLEVLYANLDRYQRRVELLEQFYAIITVLRTELLGSFSALPWLEDLCHSALLLIGEWLNRVRMRALYEQDMAAVNIRASIERLSTVLDNAALSETLEAVLPTTKIRSACLSLYDDGTTARLRAFSIAGVGHAAELRGSYFEPKALAPSGFLALDHRQTFVLMPLTHGAKLYGQALFEAGDHLTVYAMLREQVGALLKAAELHRTVVEETARRERAERERLERETDIAQQIQTAILPERIEVPGLDIAAVMRPATNVGGDYYDVIPVEGGCYLGIGDVTGHGLLAGMIMMMVQCMITATIRANPTEMPSRILPPINTALFSNIRNRLHGTDHVTLTLIKYEEQGKLIFSGAHEDPLIWRKRTGKCERLSSPGFWLGALEDIESMSSDLEVTLEAGDQLILYTDGITEAMNGSHEQFGLNRLVAVIERRGAESPTQLCASVLSALASWSSTQIDDVSLVVARYQGQTRA